MTEIEPLGDRAFLVSFADSPCAESWAAAVRAAALPGVIDVVPAFAKVAVFGDGISPMDDLEARLKTIVPASTESTPSRELEIPVRYDGDDLTDVARRLHLDISQVIAEHAQATYLVQAMGFLPGYPYAGPLPPALRGLSRRESPRVRVPAGSVAIVGNQTGVYPEPSPGGWHLIGRTPLRIVDVPEAHFPIRVGDRIRFHSIDDAEFRAREGELL